MSDLTEYQLNDSYDNYDAFLEDQVLEPVGIEVEEVSISDNLTDDLRSFDGQNPSLRNIAGGYVGPDGLVYNTYSGTDIVAQIVLPREDPITLGEIQTLSYSIHRENQPVRFLGHTNPSAFVHGARTISGSLIFTVFNNYAFYRLEQYKLAIRKGLYPVADMLPPFDIVITFANESGALSKMKIYGVTIIDEGGTMSIDDLLLESTFTYMARGIQPLTGNFILPRNAVIPNGGVTVA